MRYSSLLVAGGSILATIATLTNAFLINKQFYPAMVYITKSNASMAVIYVQALIVVYFFFQLLRKILFGDLRAAEADHLSERAWHAVLETCLAFTVFRDDFSPVFVMQFVMLLFVKCFHWLADDRVDMMERSPVITIKFHLRMLAIVGFLAAVDSYMVSHAYFSILSRGASSQIVFGFEYAILITLVVHVSIKYILHMHDLRTAQSWENKAVYLLYAELVVNLLRCVLYGLFAMVMMKLHTFPLFSVRPFYLSVRALHKAFNDVIMSRRAINAMNNLFPVVSTEDLSSMDATCIICREEMTADSQPKRLPCSHVFHAHCLRSWFQRQQTCPTCRTDILGNGIGGAAPAAARPAAPAGANGAPQAPNGGNMPNFMPFLAHQFAFHAAPQQGNNQPAAGAPPTGVGAAPAGGAHPPPFPPFMGAHFPAPPAFMGQMPAGGMFMPPPPPPPTLPFPERPSLDGLSDEELRNMEGTTRVAVESRIRQLENIAVLLDAAGLQMQQYMAAVSRLTAIPTPTFSPSAAPMTSSPAGNTEVPEPAGTESNQPVPDTAAATTVPTTSPVVDSSERESTPPTNDDVMTPSTSGLFNKNNSSPGPASDIPSTSEETHTSSVVMAAGSSPTSTAEEIRQRRLRRFADDSSA